MPLTQHVDAREATIHLGESEDAGLTLRLDEAELAEQLLALVQGAL